MSTRKGWQKEQAALARRVKASQRGAGFTLLEILVALAIFVIGAVAIIRIFPPALGVIQGSENRTIATNISRDKLARYSSNPNALPESIYNPTNYYSDPSDPFQPFAGAVSGTTIRNDSLPATIRVADFERSALGNIRRIVGERHPVLSNGTQRYVVTEYAHNGGSGPNNSLVVFVEDTVVGARVNQDGELDFTNARLQTLDAPFNDRDYGRPGHTPPGTPQGPTATPPQAPYVYEAKLPPAQWRGTDSIYYVSYRWTGAGGRIQGVVDEPLVTSTGYTIGNPINDYPTVVMGRSPGPNRDIIPEEVSIRVKRRIDRSTVPAVTEADSIRGLVPLWIGPWGPGPAYMDLMNGSTFAYRNVSVNYTVRDWRWMINYDSPAPMGEVNSRQAGIITLPHRNFDIEHLLDAINYTTNSGTTVYGLLTYQNGGNTEYGVGQWDGESVLTDDGRILSTATPSNPDDYGVSRKGTIRYDIGQTATPANAVTAPRARTAYWTGEAWAQQLSVAARSYIPYEAIRTGAEREPWREYFWNGPDTGDDDGRLYFSPTEAGKTVMVTFEYDAGGGDYKTKTGVYSVEVEQITVPAGASGVEDSARDAVGVENTISYVELGDPEDNGAPYDVTAILAVQGLSVQARTAWIEGDRYQQASATGYRPINQS